MQQFSINVIPQKFYQYNPQLECYELCQYLGQNKQEAIYFTLIHGFYFKQLEQHLKRLIKEKYKFIDESSQLISKIIEQSLQQSIPIKYFFIEYAKQQEENKVSIIKFFYQFMKQNNLLIKNDDYSLQSICNFFDVTFVIYPLIDYFGRGQYRFSIYFDQQQKKYYFLIPNEKIQLPKQQCQQCYNKLIEIYTPACNHKICLQCLRKQGDKPYYQCLVCLQKILHISVQKQLNEIQLKQQKHNECYEFYQKQKIKNNNDQQNENLENINNQIIQQCDYCKNQLNNIFISKNCTHKLCIKCLNRLQNRSYDQNKFYCYCGKVILLNDFNNYQEQQKNNEQKEILQIQNQNTQNCMNCNIEQSIDKQYLFPCGHSICNKCIQDLKTINSITYCRQKNCHYKIIGNDFENYCKQLPFLCDFCKGNYNSQNLYQQIVCGHRICFECLEKKQLQSNIIQCINGCSNIFFGTDLQQFYDNQQQLKLNEILQYEQQELEQKQMLEQLKQNEKKQSNNELSKENNEIQNEQENQNLTKKITLEIDNRLQKNLTAEQTIKSSQSFINLDMQKLQTKRLKNINQSKIANSSILSPQKTIKIIDKKKSGFQQQNLQQNELIIDKNEIQDIKFQQEVQLQQIDINNIKQDWEILLNENSIGQCTMCYQDFSEYNLKQDIKCSIHQIGVCCIQSYKNCPQCEKKKNNNIKKKLEIQQYQIEQEFYYEPKIYYRQENSQQIGSQYNFKQPYPYTITQSYQPTSIIDKQYLQRSVRPTQQVPLRNQSYDTYQIRTQYQYPRQYAHQGYQNNYMKYLGI